MVAVAFDYGFLNNAKSRKKHRHGALIFTSCYVLVFLRCSEMPNRHHLGQVSVLPKFISLRAGINHATQLFVIEH